MIRILFYTCFLGLWFAQCTGAKSASTTATVKSNGCIDSTKINPDRICPTIYQPVCGCDGKTYSNSCIAESKGIMKWTEGACK